MSQRKSPTAVLPRVLQYLSRHPGEELHVDAIWDGMRRADMVDGIDRKQVLSSLNAASRSDQQSVTYVRRMTYVYESNGQPPATPLGELFECVDEMKDGAFLLKSSNGTYYKAVKL